MTSPPPAHCCLFSYFLWMRLWPQDSTPGCRDGGVPCHIRVGLLWLETRLWGGSPHDNWVVPIPTVSSHERQWVEELLDYRREQFL
jgi:hypothetical protein